MAASETASAAADPAKAPAPSARRRYRPRLSEAQKKAMKRRRKNHHDHDFGGTSSSSFSHSGSSSWSSSSALLARLAMTSPDPAQSVSIKPAVSRRQQQPRTAPKRRYSMTTSLPLLLSQRESQGHWRSSRACRHQWQLAMTTTVARGDQSSLSYRPYTQQELDFASLDTPVTDAILGLDRKGCYAFAIADAENPVTGGSDENCIVIKAYGLPSPAVIEQAARNDEAGAKWSSLGRPVSPLLWSLPLTLADSGRRLNSNSHLCATLPFKINLSSDGQVAVANVAAPPADGANCDEVSTFLISIDPSKPPTSDYDDNDATAVASMPFCWKQSSRHVQEDDWQMLWKVGALPVKYGSKSTCSQYLDCPGYVLASQNKMIVNFTWFRESAWKAHDKKYIRQVERDENNNLDDVQGPQNWLSVCKNPSWSPIGHGDHKLELILEQELDIVKLVTRIFERHPNLYREPDAVEVCHTLVAFRTGGRTVEFFLGFRFRDQFASVVVAIDLFTGTFQEHQWTKYKEDGSFWDSSWMRLIYCLNWRMRQLGVGPYSVDLQHGLDWAHLVTPDLTELQGLSDFDRDVWCQVLKDSKSLANGRTGSSKGKARTVSLISIYPDSHVLDNRALMAQTPVFSMRAHAGPVKLVYLDAETADLW